MSRLVLAVALAACPAKPVTPAPPPAEGDRHCAKDSDCTANDSCRRCGQCFSVQPALEVDCEAVCLNLPQCRCIAGLCTAPGDRRCAKDSDCTPSGSCRYCGQCFSAQPELDVDCKAECAGTPTCTCTAGRCAAR